MNSRGALDSEASVKAQITHFSRYLVGTEPTEYVRERYAHAIAHTSGTLTERDTTLLHFMLQHPWAIGPIDGALALVNPTAEVRRRLFLAFAILETEPSLASAFLPRQRGPLYVIVVGLVGIRAVLRALLGLILLKGLRA